MYLSILKLWNFRKFGNGQHIDLAKPDVIIPFNGGLNVLIGENDSGKTAIIDAIKLVLDTHSSEWVKIDSDDFCGDSKRFRIECRFDELTDNEAKNFTEWLGMDGEGEESIPYLRVILDVSKEGDRILPYDIRAGLDDEGYRLTAEARDYLKTTYLKPLRDAKSELMPKKGSRLSQILAGHEAFKNQDDVHWLKGVFQEFGDKIEAYFKENQNGDENGIKLRAKLEEYLCKFFGEEKTANFSITKKNLKDILEILKLALEEENLGLGSHNLLFIAAELLNLERTDWCGLRLGLIEELEAHLHPQAQLKVIEYLQDLAESVESSIQLIVTTHSPNIGSKVKLKNLLISCDGNIFPMRPTDTKLDESDYKFLERFLDVTKANLFFAKGVILVEGWAEEIILPSIAKKAGFNLTTSGVSVINVGSTAFLRYAKIFQRNSDPEMDIPVSIITDLDVKPEEANVKDDSSDMTKAEIQKKNKEESYNGQGVKTFVSPSWTLEYCIYMSSCLSTAFQEIVKQVHSRTDWDSDFEKTLKDKLADKSLNKTEIAYRLAEKIENDMKLEAPTLVINPDDETDDINYLLKAIKHAAVKNTNN